MKKTTVVKRSAEKAAVAQQQTPAAQPVAAKAARRTYTDAQTVTVLVKENPFHGPLAARFATLLSGKVKTVGKYEKYTDLRFFVCKRAISIK